MQIKPQWNIILCLLEYLSLKSWLHQMDYVDNKWDIFEKQFVSFLKS